MPDRSAVLAILKNRLGIPEPPEIRPLAGDASNRSYYRLVFEKGGRFDSLILMELAEPEAFKKSEEAASQSAAPVLELPFVNILRHLARSNVAVPVLHYYDTKAGLLFLEDLGDETLENAARSADEDGIRDYYRRAIDELLKIQGPVTRNRDSRCVAFGRAFDVPLLMWEFDHFLEYGIETRQGRQIKSADRKRIRSGFLKISEELATEPKVFTHRDFHSRNLMVHRGNIRVLDFQDALLGPVVYDPASLLRDSYADLTEKMVDELIEYYRVGGAREMPGDQNPSDFRRRFDFMSLQRNLKAAGRFVYIDVVKKKNHLLPYLPRTLENVRRNLERYPELKNLARDLKPYVVEWSGNT